VHRAGKALRKLVMQTRANSVAWNPMEAFNFTAASEDCNLYSYDMRKLASATCVHQVLSGVRLLGAVETSDKFTELDTLCEAETDTACHPLLDPVCVSYAQMHARPFAIGGRQAAGCSQPPSLTVCCRTLCRR
jgi:hypothetical protein